MSARELDERRFARLLWAYPAHWRARHGAAMLGTVMDAAEHAGRDRPTPGERAELMGRGLSQTLLGWMPGGMRAALGEAALATGFALAVVLFWFHWREPNVWRGSSSSGADLFCAFGPFANPGVVVCALLVAAFALAFTPWRTATRTALGTAAALTVLLPVLSLLVPVWDRPSATSIIMLLMLALLGVAAERPSRRVLGLGGGLVLGLLAWFELQRQPFDIQSDRWFWYSTFGSTWLAYLPVIAALLAALFALVRLGSGARTVIAFAVLWLPPALIGITIRDAAYGAQIASAVSVAAAALILLRWLGVRMTRVRPG